VEIGKRLSDGIEHENLIANFSIDEETKTGKCACVVVDKERALCADLGASMKYKTEHMRENIHLAKDAKILYSTGFFITSNFEALMIAAKYAFDNNKPFAINLSAVFVVQFYKAQLLELMPYADYVFGNEDEFKAWGVTHEYGEVDLNGVISNIAALGKANHQR
jgi:adenosine kinase